MSSPRGASIPRRSALALVAAVLLGTATQGGPIPPADRLVEMQNPDGSWADWPGMEIYTGYIVAGLVRSYEMSGYEAYKTSAEAAGQWVLDNLWPNIVGEEAYAMQRLSEVAPDPMSNEWRTQITDFYEMVRNSYPGGTWAYIAEQIIDVNDPSIAAISIAHHVSAAYYVQAFDAAVWRAQLINALAGVTDDTAYYPVMALGASLWALALTGELDNTKVDPDAPPGSTWYDVELKDLPGILGGHQEPVSGSFYWRFDHGTAPGYPAYGYTEDTVFGTLGLMASAASGFYDVEVLKGIGAVMSGFLGDGSMGEHLWEPTFTAHVYAGEALRLVLPEPTSAALLGGCLAALAWRKRRQREARRGETERL